MAFLAPIIMGYLAEAGVVAEAGVLSSEVAGSTVGPVIAGSVLGSIASGAAGIVSNAATAAVDSVLGQGTTTSAVAAVNNTKNQAEAVAPSLLTGDYNDLLKQKIAEKKAQISINSQGVASFGSAPSPASNSSNSGPSNSSNSGPGVSSNPFQDAVFSNPNYSSSGTQPGQGLVMNSNIPVTDVTNKQKIIDIAVETAGVLNDHTTEIMKNPSGNVMSSFPTTSWTSGPILDYILTKNISDYIPFKDPDFAKIFPVYTGVPLIRESVHIKPNPNKPGEWIYSAYDEVGDILFFFSNTNYTPIKSLPPINDTFTGINSINRPVFAGDKYNQMGFPVSDGLPKRGSKVSVFSAYHDFEYQMRSNFNKAADMKYISRLYNSILNKTMPANEIAFARNAIIYFATMGSLVSMFSGNKGSYSQGPNSNSNSGPDSVIRPLDPQTAFSSGLDNTNPNDSLHYVNYVDPSIDMNDENAKIFEEAFKNALAQKSDDLFSNVAVYSNNKEVETLRSIQLQII